MDKIYALLISITALSFLMYPETEASEEGLEAQAESEASVGGTLILVGEGGTAYDRFMEAARSYQSENGGEIYEVSSGDEAVEAFNQFFADYGAITHLEYFGHGNEIALFVNQTPGINGAFYANDPSLNEDYIAGTIYELKRDLFASDGTAKFNGCNVASEELTKDSFAEHFANHFGVTVEAPTGPTEFLEEDGKVVMVPTYEDEGFITIEPGGASESGYSDVFKGEQYEEAIRQLTKAGFTLDDSEEFRPYQPVTYTEAQAFCKFATQDQGSCSLDDFEADEQLRNLRALQLLVDSFDVELATSSTWHQPYTRWADEHDLLTEDFINKVTYTRAEMAQLTWNFIEHFSK